MFALVVATAVLSADAPWSSRYDVTNWTVSDGLPQTSVTDIAEDDRGYLWIATLGGLVRFDGRLFERLSGSPRERANGARFSTVASLGKIIWAGTVTGQLYRFDESGRAPPELVALPQPATSIEDLLATKTGSLLVAAGAAGVLEFEASGRSVQLTAWPARALAETTDGAIWGLTENEVQCLRGCARPVTVTLSGTRSIWALTNGALGVSTSGGVFTLRDGELLEHDAPSSVRGTYDPVNKREWLASDGALIIERQGLKERVFLPHPHAQWRPDDLWQVSARVLFLDAQRTMWVGTDDAGLFRVRDRFLRLLVPPPPTARSVALVAPLPEGGALVAGACTGLFALSANLDRLTRTAGFRDSSCVSALMPIGAGQVLVGVDDALYRWTPEGVSRFFEFTDSGLNKPELRALLVDGDVLWVGTHLGLARLALAPRRDQPIRVWTTADGLPSAAVTALALLRDGALAVGTAQGAVRLADGKVGPLLRSADDKPASVRDFHVTDDVVWLATAGDGLARIERSTGTTRWMGTGDGFCADDVSRIIVNGDAWWLNTNTGVYHFSTKQLETFLAGGPLDAQRLLSGEGNGGAHLSGGFLANGDLAFPTVEGVVVINPKELPPLPPPKPLYVERATVGGKTLAISGFTEVPPSRRRDFSVRLSTPHDAFRTEPPIVQHTLSRDGVVVSKQLRSFDSSAVDLEPGDWVFEARTDERSRPSAVLRFRVKPFLWERTSARLAALLAIVGAVLVALRVVSSRAEALRRALAERVRGDAARKERDLVYFTLFDGSPAPLLSFRGGQLAALNPAAMTLFDLSTHPLTGWLPTFATENDARRFQTLLNEAGDRNEAFTIQTDGGRVREVRMKAARLGGEGDRVVVAALDVTAEVEANREREAMLARASNAQRLEGLGRLAAGVAHDFNNVLATLQLEIDHLQKNSMHPTSLDSLQQGIDAGKRLAQRFLVFGKEEGPAAPLVLDDAVERSKPLLERLLRPDVKLDITCLAPRHEIRIIPGHLDQVLLNLVVNAHDAIGTGRGTIRVKTHVLGEDEVPVGVVMLPRPRQVPCIALAVADTGSGMTAETLAHAFEPFFTTKEAGKGTGMGLAVVHGIAMKLAAGLFVDTKPGTGTTISLVFPSESVLPSPIPFTANIEADVSLNGLRVLICEDTVPLRRAMVRLFKSVGLEVTDVENGTLGLKAFEARPFDLVVTDLMMPELNGAQLIAALRKSGSRVPVILLSGYPQDAIEQLDNSLREDVLSAQKPWTSEELIRLAKMCLKKRVTAP